MLLTQIVSFFGPWWNSYGFQWMLVPSKISLQRKTNMLLIQVVSYFLELVAVSRVKLPTGTYWMYRFGPCSYKGPHYDHWAHFFVLSVVVLSPSIQTAFSSYMIV